MPLQFFSNENLVFVDEEALNHTFKFFEKLGLLNVRNII
jgi:hypothetical protein